MACRIMAAAFEFVTLRRKQAARSRRAASLFFDTTPSGECRKWSRVRALLT
jgi:hypothetical protein